MFAGQAWDLSLFSTFSPVQSDTRSDTLAILFWYINAHKSILSQEAKKKGNQGPKDKKKKRNRRPQKTKIKGNEGRPP